MVGYPGRRFAAAPLRCALGYYVTAPSGRKDFVQQYLVELPDLARFSMYCRTS